MPEEPCREAGRATCCQERGLTERALGMKYVVAGVRVIVGCFLALVVLLSIGNQFMVSGVVAHAAAFIGLLIAGGLFAWFVRSQVIRSE